MAPRQSVTVTQVFRFAVARLDESGLLDLGNDIAAYLVSLGDEPDPVQEAPKGRKTSKASEPKARGFATVGGLKKHSKSEPSHVIVEGTRTSVQGMSQAEIDVCRSKGEGGWCKTCKA